MSLHEDVIVISDTEIERNIPTVMEECKNPIQQAIFYNEKENSLLNELSVRKIKMKGDGHCLIYCLEYFLKRDPGYIKKKFCDELMHNKEFYTSFLIDGGTIETVISEYIEKKCYNHRNMDLILNVFCNSLEIVALVYRITVDGTLHKQEVLPTKQTNIESPCLQLLLHKEHYDLLEPRVNSNTNESNWNNDIEDFQRSSSDNDSEGDTDSSTSDSESELSECNDESENIHIIQYLNDEQSTPIFSAEHDRNYTLPEILKIVTNCQDHANKICTKVPTSVRNSCSFIVDASKLSNIEDIKSNDCPAMESHGQKLRQIYEADEGEIIVKIKFDEDFEDAFYIYEYISKTKCKGFIRKIYYVYSDSKRKNLHRYVFMLFKVASDYQYTLKPHGNSKTIDKFYTQTKSSVKADLLKNASTMPPKKCLSETRKNFIQSASSDFPRNYDQANYARRISRKADFKSVDQSVDEFKKAVYMAKKPGDNFVKTVSLIPEGILLLCSDNQLNDVYRFCAEPTLGKAAIFSADLTFDLGDFYVFVSSYKNPMLLNKRGKNPVHIGPCQIQHRKLLSSYKSFCDSLIKEKRGISSLKVFGSDNEENIIAAFKDCFPNIINLQCFRHFKQNIQRRLVGWKGEDVSYVFNDIFGTSGLVNCQSQEEVDEKYLALKPKWIELEKKNRPSSKDGFSFYEWFQYYKLNFLKYSMIASVRSLCGLPMDDETAMPEEFTTNAAENANSQIKNWCGENLKLNEFITKLRTLVEEQEHQYIEAVSGIGDHSFHPDFEFLHKGSDWFSMKTIEKQRHLKLVHDSPYETIDIEIPRENVAPVHNLDDLSTLNMPSNIPEDISSAILTGARKLIDENNVRKAFNSDNYEVPRDYSSKPLTLTVTKKGQVHCKKLECLNFNMFKLCEHSLAVAVHIGKINILLEEAKKNTESINLANTSRFGMPSGAGTKRGYTRQKKKASRKRKADKPGALNESKRQFLALESSLTVTHQPNYALGQSMGPKPPQPETQNQTYVIIRRSGNISKCNGCNQSFDKSSEIAIFGRYEMDWYPFVDKEKSIKTYSVTKRNFYYCLMRSCILARRPQLDIKSMNIIEDTVLNEDERENLRVEFERPF